MASFFRSAHLTITWLVLASASLDTGSGDKMREVTSIGLISESVMGQSDAKWWLKRAEEDDKSLWDPRRT